MQGFETGHIDIGTGAYKQAAHRALKQEER